MPHWTGILCDWTDGSGVKAQQVVLSGARSFELLQEVQT